MTVNTNGNEKKPETTKQENNSEERSSVAKFSAGAMGLLARLSALVVGVGVSLYIIPAIAGLLGLGFWATLAVIALVGIVAKGLQMFINGDFKKISEEVKKTTEQAQQPQAQAA